MIYDVRFSTIPNQVEGLWGIKLDENKKDSEHVEYVTNRKRDLDRFNILINMVSGTHENWKIYQDWVWKKSLLWIKEEL